MGIDPGLHYHFTVNGNQPELLEDIAVYFQRNSEAADFTRTGDGKLLRNETRKIWVTTKLNHFLNFPYVHQTFMIERESIRKNTGEIRQEVVYGVTSIAADQATPKQILGDNRVHWCVESCHYIIDWNYDEDRGQIRTGFGPENITRLRRFAIGLLKSKKGNEKIPEKMKKLMLNTRAVLDCLKMTRNSNPLSIS